MSKSFVWIDGQFFPEDQAVFTVKNRSFAYGDGLFETIHAFGTTARHLQLHFDRISKGFGFLELDPPPYFTPQFLDNEITRTLNKNRIFGSARVRLTAYREDGGYYSPHGSGVHFSIQAKALPNNFYELNKKGLVVDVYTDLRKPINELSSIKSCNSLLYVMAGLYKNKLGLDDCLLINDQNRVAEAISSNLFFVIGNNLYTPSLKEGCVEGIMRHLVIITAKQLGVKVLDEAAVDPHDLLHADELFLTNAVKGIQWVVGLKERRYFCKISRLLSDRINTITFPDQFKDGFSG
jgi:branched-chain amino acid aminotransferase